MPANEDHAEMVAELSLLRRGHGLHAPDAMQRIGPRLMAVAGIEPGMTSGERRTLLMDKLSQAVQTLPNDLRLAVEAAFGLHPEAQSRFLNERMAWLGRQLDRDPRTATRRVQDGLELLAEHLLSHATDPGDDDSAFAPRGWYVESQRSTLMLHFDPVRLHENRRVVSTRDGLDRLTVSWSIPAETPADLADLRVDMLFGGRLHRDEDTSTLTYWNGWVELPRPLAVGDRHEFELVVTTVPRRLFRPYFVMSPYRRCDEFIARVKFDAGIRPESVWQLDGVPFEYVNANQPVGRLLDLDGIDEVTSRFTNLQKGFSYGVRWHDQADHPA
jgi:hypothetical protein